MALGCAGSGSTIPRRRTHFGYSHAVPHFFMANLFPIKHFFRSDRCDSDMVGIGAGSGLSPKQRKTKAFFINPRQSAMVRTSAAGRTNPGLDLQSAVIAINFCVTYPVYALYRNWVHGRNGYGDTAYFSSQRASAGTSRKVSVWHKLFAVIT
jgi:hypothetical protein